MKLIFFVEGDLNSAESDLINRHLQNCKECQFLYNQLKASLAFLQKDRHEEVNPFFITRVMEKLSHQPKQHSILSWLKIKEYSLQVSVYSFLVALAIFSGYYLGKDKVTDDQVSINQDSVITDNQLFAESYQIQISEEDVYLINGDNNLK